MSEAYDSSQMENEGIELLPKHEVLGRMDELISEMEQAQREICTEDPHIRYPDSAMHFGQIIRHLEAIRTCIKHRQEHGVRSLPAYQLHQHSTLCSVLDDKEEIKRLYE